MLALLIVNRDAREKEFLIQNARNAVALLSDDRLEITDVVSGKEAEDFIRQNNLMDAAFLDVAGMEEIEMTRQIRKSYELSELLLIADSSISPMEYMTPDIRAASLLLRPFTKETGGQVIRQFFHALYRTRNIQETDEKVLIVENREGKIPIPYSQIYYMEVCEKKVYIRLKEKEYSRYDSLDSMAKELPEQFLRCHRSFIVNTSYIERVKLSENTIYLEDGITVPLSRSYKMVIKEYMNSRKG